MDVGHLYERETRTWKREWNLTRRTKHGYVGAKIPAQSTSDAIEKASALLAYLGEFEWEQRGETHFVAVTP